LAAIGQEHANRPPNFVTGAETLVPRQFLDPARRRTSTLAV
jgi:hypothetical protein